jgi:hypothetical protein
MSTPPSVVLSLVSHTNVGKTTLARTLLRRDVGEVLDQAHVTDATERFVLHEADGAKLVLSDNPGFGDSVRLLRRLRGLPDPIAWLVGQVWDRFRDRPLFCSQEAARHVREEADAVLYLVNASEDPEQAGYVAPELELLGWIGRPVVLLLNQTGPPRDAEGRERDTARWRALRERHPGVADVLSLDAFTRCWVQEGLLWERVRDVLPADRRPLMDAWLERWRAEQAAIFRGSADALAALLAVAANDFEPIRGGGRRELRRAADELGRRLREAVTAANERLIALHGLDGEAAEALRIELGDVTAPEPPAPSWLRTVWGGLVGGAVGGVAADLATGGLTLGGGALVGAILGAAGGRGLAFGMELLKTDEAPRAAWSRAFAERLATDTVLRYLAVAHFGRGAGSFRVRDHPETFRAAAERAVASRREWLRGANGAEIVPTLERALLEALAQLHPEGAHLLPSPR